VLLVVLGLGLRAWAGGSAGRHTRRATIEAPQLATGGPFAYVRNPIYLSSIILGLGMVGLLGDPWMFALYVLVFVFLYGAIVPAEEQFLRREFGEEYTRYCEHVPRLWPRLRRWSGARAAVFDRHVIFGEVRLGLVLVGIYAFLRACAWLRG
jgi:protein-S-isoprenylcysteine O-methyltransferase Ste14